MDPQLRAIREAKHRQFLTQNAAAVATEPPARVETVARDAASASAAAPKILSGSAAGDAAVQASKQAGPGTVDKKRGMSDMLQGLPPELLNAPISSLLADAPPPEPPVKRLRPEPGVMRVPKERTAEIRQLLAQPAPSELRILSWNIDGLDEVGGPDGLMLRTLAVAREVALQRPVAVLLQEAVPPALELLSAPQVLGGTYEVVVPRDPPMPYYVAIFLDKRRAKRLQNDFTEITFPSSRMGRQLLAVRVEFPHFPGLPLLLSTAHLESTKDCAAERKRQLAQALRFLRKAQGAALLAGDLNLRDEEVKAVQRELGPEAEGIADGWMYCGSPDGARWTWDTGVNDNVGASFVCRSRFDRLYFCSPGVSDSPGHCITGTAATKKAANKAKAKAKTKAAGVASPDVSSGDTSARGGAAGWRPTSFTLVGRDRVPGLGRYPSDHWGILTTWNAGQTREHVMPGKVVPVASEQAKSDSAQPSKTKWPPLRAGTNAANASKLAIDLDEDTELHEALAISVAGEKKLTPAEQAAEDEEAELQAALALSLESR